MKARYYLYIVIFLFTYLLSVTSVLYTESFILFLAGFIIFVRLISEKHGVVWNYKKTDFKWNELIIFYLVFKTWHRCIMRDANIKIINFLLLSLQMQKYEVEWMKKNINKINNRDYIALKATSLRRLEILSGYKKIMKSETSVLGLRRLPIAIE
jgi:hypothetical protein